MLKLYAFEIDAPTDKAIKPVKSELSVILWDSDVHPTMRSNEPKKAVLPPRAVTLTKKW